MPLASHRIRSIQTSFSCFLLITSASACAAGDSSHGNVDAGRGVDADVKTDASERGDGNGDGDADGEDASVDVNCEPSGASEDADHDGFSTEEGDCRDCDPNVNPGAFDVPGNSLDEDCSGTPDDEPTTCDTGLPVEANDPFQAARALGLCKMQKGDAWGLVSAQWVFPDGSTSSLPDNFCPTGLPPHPLSHGIVGKWGDHVATREGASMVALSSGAARSGTFEVPEMQGAYGQSPGNAVMCRVSKIPAGFPKDSPSCPGVNTAKETSSVDGIALELKVQVPSNAHALQYDFDFYSTEFPTLVCTDHNDHYVALLWSKHPKTPADKNISFDSKGNVVSVNNTLMEICTPVTYEGRTHACKRGDRDLGGTGFDNPVVWEDGTHYLQGGATGWLTTTASVVPGEIITLRFAVWDLGFPNFDSTVLLDHFRWLVREGQKPVIEAPPTTDPIFLQ